MRLTTDIRLARVAFGALALAGALVAEACSGGGGDTSTGDVPCVTGLTPSCAASYAPPTFDAIFMNILKPNCAVGTGTCHTSDFAAGGIVFADEATSYATLLGTSGGAAYVLPTDAGCSVLMKRLTSSDPSYHMPRGPNSLSLADQCTIVQWISAGAAR